MAAMLGLVLADDAIAPLRVLGADERQLLPPHRLRPRAGEGAQGGAAGAPRHRRRAASPSSPASLLLGQAAGTLQLSALGTQAAAIQAHPLYLPALLLVLLGAFTKSAQFPFHFWLPGAMAAPTPGQRVPALGHDGEGGHLPPRPPEPRPRRHRRLALPRDPGRRGDARDRGRPRLRPDGPQAPPRLHDAQRARHAHRPRRRSRPSPRRGRRWCSCSSTRSTRPRSSSGRARSTTRRARATCGCLGGLARAMPLTAFAVDRVRPLDGRAAALLRLRGEGALLRGEAGGAAGGDLLVVAELRRQRPRRAAAGLVAWRPFFGRDRGTPKHAHEAPPALWLGPVVLASLSVALGLLPDVLAVPLVQPAASAMRGEHTEVVLRPWVGMSPAFVQSLLDARRAAPSSTRSTTGRSARSCPCGASPPGGRRAPTRLSSPGSWRVAKAQTRVLQNGVLGWYLRRHDRHHGRPGGLRPRRPAWARSRSPFDAVRPGEAAVALAIVAGAVAVVRAPGRSSSRSPPSASWATASRSSSSSSAAPTSP